MLVFHVDEILFNLGINVLLWVAPVVVFGVAASRLTKTKNRKPHKRI
jgi:hypothetical protein